MNDIKKKSSNIGVLILILVETLLLYKSFSSVNNFVSSVIYGFIFFALTFIVYFFEKRINKSQNKNVFLIASIIETILFLSVYIYNSKKNVDIFNIIEVIASIFFTLEVILSKKKQNPIIVNLITIIIIFPFYILSIKYNFSFIILLVSLSLYMYKNYDETAVFRKKNIIFYGLEGLILLFIKDFNIAVFFIFTLFLLRMLEDSKKFSRKLKTVIKIYYFIVLVVKIIRLIIFKNTFNTYMKIDNIFGISILYILLLCMYSSIKESNNKTFINNLFIFLIYFVALFVDKSFFEIAIYVPILLYIMSEDLYLFNYKKYVNIYKEKYFKKKINNPYKVSVVIPNYNYANYIIERIDSVLLQTYPIYELIILDDKSTDNSIEVINKKIDEIKKDYPELIVKIIPNKTNSGNVFKQWAKAFKESTGDFLWIAEADDSCSNIFLETVMKGFKNDKKAIISYTESLTMDENNKITKYDLRDWIDIFNTGKWNDSFIDTGNDYVENFLCINNTIANVSSLVFRKEKNIDFQKYLKEAEEYHLAGDWLFYEKVLQFGDIVYDKNSLNYHRMHSNSVTLTTKREKEYIEMKSIQNDIENNYNLTNEMKIRVEERRERFRHNFNFSEEEIKLNEMDLSKIIKSKKINDKILLSIIVPVYNTEKYLKKCITSILKSLPEYSEVIVVNDGSPDDSEKIIKEMMKEYPNKIKYFKKKNGGLSSAKNYGLKKAEGKYIGFIDSDDYVKEDMFSCMLKEALINNSDIVICDVNIEYENGTKNYVSSINSDDKDYVYSILDVPIFPTSCNKVAKKELFDSLDYPEGLNNEDVAVSPVLLAKSKKINYIPTAFYNYLQRTGSIQNSGFNEKRFVVFKTAKICEERISKYNKELKEKIMGTIYIHQLFSLLIYLISNVKNKKERYKYIEKFNGEINQFDYENNKYLNKYLEDFKITKLKKLIKNNDIKQIDKLIRNI